MAVDAVYDEKLLSAAQIGWILDQFVFLLAQVTSQSLSNRILGEFIMAGPVHCEQLYTWNQHLPQTVQTSVHSLVEEQCKARSRSIAIDSWDGQLTYRELDQCSSSLAARLVRDHGVQPETYVPVCLEKSKWMPVAMLAVLKAGGGFVLLDPSHPMERRRALCQQVQATVLLTSVRHRNTIKSMGLDTAIIAVGDDASVGVEGKPPPFTSVVVNAHHPAYIVFTSGSTGTPKGVVVGHGALATNAMHMAPKQRIRAESRVLQLTTCTFDVCVAEIFYSLTQGACVCIPDEAECRNSLEQTFNKYDITWSTMTPSMARVLNPLEMPRLETLVLGSEAMQTAEVAMWTEHVTLLNAYGPSECCIDSTVSDPMSLASDASDIGRAISGACWVVDPNDAERLTPIGAVGELIIEGPIVARGYLNDPEKTGSVFISPPSWLQAFRSGRATTVYRTGDLVRYGNTGDGSLRYIGRKDQQIKLRGQRIELGEVEFNLAQCFPDAEAVVAEAVRPVATGGHPVLTGFICFSSHDQASVDKDQSPLLEGNDAFRSLVTDVQATLAQRVPSYMVPGLLLPLRYLPLNSSGKTDRKLLKARAAGLSLDQIRSYRTSTGETRRAPSTSMEAVLHELVQAVLGLSAADIGMADQFFDLGGDSIHAMKLVSQARRRGIRVAVADVFNCPRLENLAETLHLTGDDKTEEGDDGSVEDVVPFFLLEEGRREALIEQAAAECGIDCSCIEDIYPCTEAQTWLIAMASRGVDNYTIRACFDLPESLNIARFQEAWKQLLQAHPIFRSRIIQDSPNTWLQVVLRDVSASLDALATPGEDLWGLGRPLIRGKLARDEESGGGYRFNLAIHHVLYDGYSLPLLFQQLEAAYNGTQLPLRPFSRFLSYIASIQETSKPIWRDIFADFRGPLFPPLPHAGFQPQQRDFREHSIPITAAATGGITVATKIRLSVALVLSHFLGTTDIVVGTAVTGRAAPILGVEEMVAPTTSVMPFRIRLPEAKEGSTVGTALQAVQMQSVRLLPLEPSGVGCIAQAGPDATRALGFQTMLIIHPGELESAGMFAQGHFEGQDQAADIALGILCDITPTAIRVRCQFDPEVLSDSQISRLVMALNRVYGVVSSQPETGIYSIDLQDI
jgi:amino acid adenylation domain-containing protein